MAASSLSRIAALLLLINVGPSVGRRQCRSVESASRSRSFHCHGGSPKTGSFQNYELTNPTACGFCAHSNATRYLARVAEVLQRHSAASCSELVVYSAALGDNFAATTFAERDLAGALPKKALWHANGRNCYFRFVLTTDLSAKKRDSSLLLERLVPLDPARLPYPKHEMRRNVKVLKMIGHKIFHWAKRTVWIDAKLRIGSIDPREYFASRVERFGVCASYMGLPVHDNAFGEGHLDRPSLKRHGENIMNAAARRPSVTDNIGVVGAQIGHYAPRDVEYSLNMVDTAYIARDFRSPRCRAFNDAFGCTWFDEIDCFSDRDQLSFPAAVGRLNVERVWGHNGTAATVLLDSLKRPTLHIEPPGTNDDPGPHWYFSNALAIGKCVTCAGHPNSTVAAAFRKVAQAARKASQAAAAAAFLAAAAADPSPTQPRKHRRRYRVRVRRNFKRPPDEVQTNEVQTN